MFGIQAGWSEELRKFLLWCQASLLQRVRTTIYKIIRDFQLMYMCVSQDWHCWHVGQGNSLLLGLPCALEEVSSILSLYLPGASSTLFLVMTIKNVSRHHPISPGGQNHLLLRTADVYYNLSTKRTCQELLVLSWGTMWEGLWSSANGCPFLTICGE